MAETAGRFSAVMSAHIRILARRRTALLVLGLLPLAFYGALYQQSEHATTVGGIASAFSAGGAGVFSMLPARAVDRRLVLAGYRSWQLVLGRLVVLEAGSLAVSMVTAGVMIAGSGSAYPAEAFIGVALVGAVAVPLGLALGALLGRELEAMLILIGIVGIQLTVPPGTTVASFLPFHAARQLLDASRIVAISIWPKLELAAGYGLVLLAIAWLAWFRRVSVRANADHGQVRVGA